MNLIHFLQKKILPPTAVREGTVVSNRNNRCDIKLRSGAIIHACIGGYAPGENIAITSANGKNYGIGYSAYVDIEHSITEVEV